MNSPSLRHEGARPRNRRLALLLGLAALASYGGVFAWYLLR